MQSAEHGHLLRNIVLFARMLRGLKINITPTQILDLVSALDYIELRRRSDVKDAARTLLINRPEHLPLFDRAFDLFWQARGDNELSALSMETILQNQPQPKQEETTISAIKEAEANPAEAKYEADEPWLDRVYTYSANEVLRHKDFADLTPNELLEVRHMMQKMQWNLEQRRTRRKVPAARGNYYDLRRTFRQNLRYGGEPLQLARRSRKTKRRPLVVLADISGSMERYARILLKFIYIISNGLDNVEAFVFSTRLTRITRQLKASDVDGAMNQVGEIVQDWAGGTRMGDALKTFNYQWGRRVLGQGAIVLIISDGWDRGDIDLLGKEMQRLQLSCQRLIWLNPLLGSETYEPLTRGMQASLPHIDDFMPVHNLASLEQLGSLLERLGEHRPARLKQVT